LRDTPLGDGRAATEEERLTTEEKPETPAPEAGTRLSLSDWAVLVVLAERPRHGFAVARELRADAPLGAIWRVARPQVYRSVERLVAQGLASLGASEPGHGPERRVATPTATGRQAVAGWATTPVDRLRHLRSELLVKLVACRRLGLDGPALLDRQVAVIAAIRGRLAGELAGSHDDRRVALLWRQATADAADRFLADARGWWHDREIGHAAP
jgi:DNA-binding PadR family transcriptional regulator